MLSKVLAILCVAAVCRAQDVNLTAIMEQIFGPSTLVPFTKPSNATQNLTCTTNAGEGVACNTQDNTVNTDGHGVIDIEFRVRPCFSYIEICCLVSKKGHPTDPVTPKPEPNKPEVEEDDLTAIQRFFRTPPPQDTTTPKPSVVAENKGPSTSVPFTKPATQNLACTTRDGQPGECVAYYLCMPDNTINTDGKGIIDIASPSEKRPPTNLVTPEPETNVPEHQGCGWRNPKGVGIRTKGETDGETKFAEFPWMCALFKIELVDDDEPDGQKLNVYVGGGSLIHPSIVLTAAHYVPVAPTLRVRAGEWDTRSTQEPYPYQDREVSSTELHKDFNKDNLFYDIAVLFLAKPMDLAPNVQPACLPPPRAKTAAGTRCYATGWGKDHFGIGGRYQAILKKIEAPVIDQNTCQEQLRKTHLGHFFELHSSFMCAGGEKDHGVCKGDGGSPLSCPIEDEPGRYVQTGIVAWDIKCGADGAPGVYVDLASLRSWIDDKVVGKGYDPKDYSY